jgi:hypothetical protein
VLSLAGLSAARLSLEDLLTRVATFAVHAIPGADGAGLTLIEHDRSDTIVKAPRSSWSTDRTSGCTRCSSRTQYALAAQAALDLSERRYLEARAANARRPAG